MKPSKNKTLSTRDVALGIGRKFTNAELSDYLKRTIAGQPITADKVRIRLLQKLNPSS